MQKPWAEADRDGTARAVAQQRRDLAQRGGALVARRDIRLEREVAVLAGAREVAPQLADQAAVRSAQAQRRIAGECQRAFAAQRVLCRKLMVVAELLEDALGIVLRL